jgi:hypothetical protein
MSTGTIQKSFDVTVAEAMEILGVTRNQLAGIQARGDLSYRRPLGGHARFNAEELKDLARKITYDATPKGSPDEEQPRRGVGRPRRATATK